jgi:hypothetical protein
MAISRGRCLKNGSFENLKTAVRAIQLHKTSIRRASIEARRSFSDLLSFLNRMHSSSSVCRVYVWVGVWMFVMCMCLRNWFLCVCGINFLAVCMCVVYLCMCVCVYVCLCVWMYVCGPPGKEFHEGAEGISRVARTSIIEEPKLNHRFLDVARNSGRHTYTSIEIDDEAPGGTRRHQEGPATPRRPQEAPGGSRRPKEAPEDPRKPQEG